MAQLHKFGESFILECSFGKASEIEFVHIGLYNSSDDLSNQATVGDITTEPQGSSYTNPLFEPPFNVSLGPPTAVNFPLANFDVSDSSVVVDSYFVFSNEEIIFSGNLDSTYDLSELTQLEVANISLSIS
jgi:hypothetical protein